MQIRLLLLQLDHPEWQKCNFQVWNRDLQKQHWTHKGGMLHTFFVLAIILDMISGNKLSY
jgi:hypothetical protein